MISLSLMRWQILWALNYGDTITPVARFLPKFLLIATCLNYLLPKKAEDFNRDFPTMLKHCHTYGKIAPVVLLYFWKILRIMQCFDKNIAF